MVKALVFGTKDLCVRIAPWSRIILHFSIFSRLRIVSCSFLVPTFDGECGYRNRSLKSEWKSCMVVASWNPAIAYNSGHLAGKVRPSQVALAAISIATWPFIRSSYILHHALLSLPTPIYSDISSSPFTPSLSMPSSKKSLKTSHAILKPNAVPAPWSEKSPVRRFALESDHAIGRTPLLIKCGRLQ